MTGAEAPSPNATPAISSRNFLGAGWQSAFSLKATISALAVVDSNGIKTPVFDPPAFAAAARPITYGSRVGLSCQGIQVTAEVMIIERFGMLCVGRVTGFTPSVKKPDGLNAGDFARFTQKDVLRVE